MLTRSQGDFEEILGLERPDRRGDGRDRARARVHPPRAPSGQARRHRQQAGALAARRGDLRGRARGRRAASLRGVSRWRRARHPRDQRDARRRSHPPRPRDRERHDELHPQRDDAHGRYLRVRARPGAGARLRRGGPVRGRGRQGRRREDGDHRAAGVQRADQPRPGTAPGDREHHARRHRPREGVRPLPEARRHRRARERRHLSARVSRFPLRRAPARVGRRGFQRGDDRVAGDHRDHAVGARRRGNSDRERRPGRRRLRDDPAAVAAGTGRGGRACDRRRVGVLPPPRGRGPAGRSRAGRGAARAPGRVGEVGRAARARRQRPPRDGHASGARVEVPGGGRADRQARLHARRAARSSG